MNMKKTIAAVAASAMAVSAMATTVSALEPLTYSLVANVENTTEGKFTLNATLSGAPNTLEGIAFLGGGTAFEVESVTITVIDDAGQTASKSYTYSTDKGALNYNPKLTNGGLVIDHELDGFSSSVSIQVTVNAKEKTKGQYKKSTDVNKLLNDTIKIVEPAAYGVGVWYQDDNNTIFGGYYVNGVAADATAYATPTQLTAFTAMSTSYEKRPLETGPNENVNIAWYLQNNNCRTETSSYMNVLPVINDAIAANETVTFTFNTATAPIAWGSDKTNGEYYGPSKSSWGNEVTDYDWDATASGYKMDGYNTALAITLAKGGKASDVYAVYGEDWYGDTSYMSFTQHLYQGTSGAYGVGTGSRNPDTGAGWWGFSYGEGYLGYNWAGQNLFGGALVINENLTMSLSDVDYFDWTNTSLSFDWDAIRDNAITTNNYATYVQSIKLATSVRWYWDSMVIDIVEGEAEDVSSSAGVEGDNEELDDGNVGGEEIIDTPNVDETPAVNETPAVDETPAEVPSVSTSPATGNAPVALAVIPVALAAAAIVAKKRS